MTRLGHSLLLGQGRGLPAGHGSPEATEWEPAGLGDGVLDTPASSCGQSPDRVRQSFRSDGHDAWVRPSAARSLTRRSDPARPAGSGSNATTNLSGQFARGSAAAGSA